MGDGGSAVAAIGSSGTLRERMRMTLRIKRLALSEAATVAASLALAAPSFAAGSQSVSIPFDGVTFGNVCNSEEVVLQGDAHAVVHGEFVEGDTQHVFAHMNFQGVSGIGSFGNEYRLVESGKSMQQSTEGAANVIAQETNFKVVGKGDTINGMIQVTL